MTSADGICIPVKLPISTKLTFTFEETWTFWPWKTPKVELSQKIPFSQYLRLTRGGWIRDGGVALVIPGAVALPAGEGAVPREGGVTLFVHGAGTCPHRI